MRSVGPLLAGALAVACAAPPRELPPVVLPIASLAASAREVVETDALDVGLPASRPALWSGWGADEKNPEMTFAWGHGAASRLRFDVVEPRRRTLRLRGWSYPFGDDPPLEVAFWLNGKAAGRRLLSTRPGIVQVPLGRELFRVGENELELRYSRHLERAGEPPYAAGWDGLRFDDSRDAEARPTVARDGGVVLPARTGLEWVLELPPGSWLAWDELASSGGAQLELSLRSEGRERKTYGGRALGGAIELTPAGPPHRLVGVTLTAAGRRGEVRLAGLRLHLPARAERAAAAPAQAPAARPNFVVYLVDTLRADRLGCYGYGRPTSPEIDRFARGAARWRDGRAQSSWTRPAVASILSGQFPIAHRTQETHDRLPAEVELLSERLGGAGWQSAFITTNGNVSAGTGFNQGWDEFVYLPERRGDPALHVQSGEVHAAAAAWLARRDPERPFLLVLHTSDPHDPYTPPEPFRSRLAPGVTDPAVGSRGQIAALDGVPAARLGDTTAQLSALYDAEIAANDASFGRLLAELDRAGLAGDTVVLLLSDHGEEFFEHGGWTHGRTLYEEQLRIPFVLRVPGRTAGEELPGVADQVDVVPTFLALAGLPPDSHLPGRDLLADLRGDGPPAGEAQSLAWLARNRLAMAAITRSQWKLIRNEQLGGAWPRPPLELYGLGSDPGEQENVALDRELRRGWLEGLLRAGDARWTSGGAAERFEMDAELEANLRALGYL